VARTDADLIAAARRGDNLAFDHLITRHRDAVVRLATRLVGPNGVDALVADAVGTVAAALRGGGGPVVCFRPYLLTTVRRRNYARASAAGRVRPIDDLAPGRTVAIAGSPVHPATLPTAAAVYRRLPEDTKVALWHTEVDGESVAEAGELIGMTGIEVAELAFSAREAFRQAHLAPYLAADLAPACRWTADRLGSFAREALSERDSDRVGDHLDECHDCRTVFPGVEAVENELRVLLAMLVLGAAAGPYLGRESQPAHRARLALAGGATDRVRTLVGAQGRSVVMLGVGVFLAAGGLAAAVTLGGTGGSTGRAENRSASPTAGALAGDKDAAIADDGPSSGSASVGWDMVAPPKRPTATADATASSVRAATTTKATAATAPAAITPAATPIRTATSTPVTVPAVAAQPDTATPEKLIADDGTVHADLGLLKVETSNEDGLIPGVLPGISILPPN
jgi:DNA-directed RNA polymerase specialized sigma24 family protein